MNIQRFGMAAVAVFVVFGLVYYGAMLVFDEQYRALFQRLDINDQPNLVFWLGAVLYTLVFCYIFVQGHEGKGIGEGVRYGLLIGLLILALDLGFFGFTSPPMNIALAISATDIVAAIAAGATVAAIYKPAEATPAEAAPSGGME